MQLGIREGKYFKGRFMASRINNEEANALVDGLKDDLIIIGLKNQNRALNGDTVCVQVLPESEWIRNFKESDIINPIDKEDPDQAIGAAD
jgi:exosome complex exonuclease DIS3/RRP44